MNKELKLSIDILNKVYFDKAYSSIELNDCITKNRNVNTSLITKIVYGVIEKDIYLNYMIKKYVKDTTKPKLQLLLKVAYYALYEINSIPPFALTNEIVERTKAIYDKSCAGFINGTIKSFIRNKDKDVIESNLPIIKKLSITYSYPEWIIDLLLKQYKMEFVVDFLKTTLTTLTHIRIINNIDEFKQKLDNLQIEYQDSQVDFCIYVDYKKLLENESEFSMQYVVQGLPSIIASLNIPAKANDKVLDMCSAPGGKSVFISQNQPKCVITACDIHSHRILLMQNYFRKFNLTNIECRKEDATKINNDNVNKYDYILCDVPCSGIGVASKKPDILFNKTANDVKGLSKTQLQILTTASNYVKDGGSIIYSTCTILQQENEDVINAFLKTHKNFTLQSVNDFNINTINKNNMVTFMPNISKCEGFFIARLVKK